MNKNYNPGVRILENTRVVDFARKRVQSCALLIEDDTIKEKITERHARPKGILKLDLRGKYVIPGFIDAHTHLVPEGIKMQRLDLSRCRSLEDCLEKIRADLKTKDISFASNWDETAWPTYDSKDHNRHTLDKLSRKKPIIMRRICGHYAVVNTAALRHIPENRKIVDRKKGILLEDAALNLNDFFPPTDEMMEKAVMLATNKALRQGITSVHEISKPSYFRALQKKKNELKIRYSIYLTEKHHKHVLRTGLRTGYGDDWLRFAGTKIFLDGSIGAHTAALKQPYRNEPIRGKILIPSRKLAWFVDTAESNGIQLMLHSIGDRTTDTALRVLKEHTSHGNPLRHRIEHLEMLNGETIAAIGRMKTIASMQPNFVHRWQKSGGFYEKVLGARYKKMNPFQSLLRNRVKLMFGSDCMPLGPLYGIQGAIKHPSEDERLSIAQAFLLYTEAGAFATFEEKKKGKLEQGYLADLVVLNENPLEERNLLNLKVEGVMVGGEMVFSSIPEWWCARR
ncbi:MAG: amidohydrolase [candidate division WOR-3 bacterium]|nr:amidohydrolase [candidate division WOR-3 bacterium]